MLRLTFLYFSRKGSGAGVVVVRDIKEVWTSLTSRGQNLVNSKDLSSNSPSGATLGLISEVLKVRFYAMSKSPFVSHILFITQMLISQIMVKQMLVSFFIFPNNLIFQCFSGFSRIKSYSYLFNLYLSRV